MRDKIYIADDDSMNRKVLVGAITTFFPNYENKIREFGDGKSLYDKILQDNKEVKLVLTDNDMPQMNGLEVIEKCSKLYPDIPFIQISGYDIGEKALKAGASHFFSKPFGIMDLKKCLENYL